MEGSLRVARPSKFGERFKRDAVRLVRTTGRSCADVARELGMNREADKRCRNNSGSGSSSVKQ
ncbi:transposase [Nonomuraea sp. NPDC050536]|uniref:transposase n=1 Tax=Nonomuraea sp. NPDC050536 TaxID=3364366 RepID=UPI0037C60B90